MQREQSDNASKPIYFSHFQLWKSTKWKHVHTAMLQSQTTKLTTVQRKRPDQVQLEVLRVCWRGYGCIWSQSRDRHQHLQVYWPEALFQMCLDRESAWKRPHQWKYCLLQNHSLCVKNLTQYTATWQCLIIHKYLLFDFPFYSMNDLMLVIESNSRNPFKSQYHKVELWKQKEIR